MLLSGARTHRSVYYTCNPGETQYCAISDEPLRILYGIAVCRLSGYNHLVDTGGRRNHTHRPAKSMRLWTIHPKYLDRKGLVALWREALLAQKVLKGKTRGYRHHPQLLRFQQQTDPCAAIAHYLQVVYDESLRRSYRFQRKKIGRKRKCAAISETRGQLAYEWRHLKRKLRVRDKTQYRAILRIREPEAHPLFAIQDGGVAPWERRKLPVKK